MRERLGARLVASVGAIGMAATAIVVIAAGSASATTISAVSDETEFRTALTTLSGDASAGPHVIEIDSDFTITDPGSLGDPTYWGTVNLEIHGNGHTIDSGVADVRFLSSSCPCNVSLDSLTVDGFSVSAAYGPLEGGAIRAEGVTVVDSTFSNNSVSVVNTDTNAVANAEGGAIYAVSGTLTIVGSAFTGNTVSVSADGDDATGSAYAEARGGAVASGDSAINIDDSTFTGNGVSASGDAWAGNVVVSGGAVYSDSGTIHVGVTTGVVFTGNTAHGELTAYRDDGYDNTVDVQGGAIADESRSVDVHDSQFDSNAVTGEITGPDDGVENTGEGGAIFTNEAVTVDGSTFTNNSVTTSGSDAAAWGGAIEAWGDGGVTVTESTFTDNSVDATATSAAETADAYGGAIEAYGDNGGAYITDSTFTGNSVASDGADDAEGYAGAISVDNDLFVYNSTFTGNSVTVNAGGDALGVGGVAVFYEDGTVTILDSEFSGNTVTATGVGEADAGGGVIAEDPDGDYADSFTVDGSTFAGNGTSAHGDDVLADGGAIFALSSEIVVTNSTFQGNSLDGVGGSSADVSGGAISVYDGDLTVDFSTFSGNDAEDGAHIYTDTSTLYPYASVFADAITGDGCDLDALGTSGFNFDSDGTCSNSSVPSDGDFGYGVSSPLESLADNGGPTRTMMPALASSLIDYIDPGDCTAGVDQRDLPRPTGTGCEPGAVERLADIPFTVVTDAGDIDGVVSNATCVQNIAWVTATGYTPAPPAGLSLPFGVSSYEFCTPEDGWTVTVQLDLPSPVNSFWKVDGSAWTQVGSATIAGTAITYDVTDGGALDTDGTANSLVVDPVGPGIYAAFTG